MVCPKVCLCRIKVLGRLKKAERVNRAEEREIDCNFKLRGHGPPTGLINQEKKCQPEHAIQITYLASFQTQSKASQAL